MKHEIKVGIIFLLSLLLTFITNFIFGESLKDLQIQFLSPFFFDKWILLTAIGVFYFDLFVLAAEFLNPNK